jgi:hypothetical protein
MSSAADLKTQAANSLFDPRVPDHPPTLCSISRNVR